MAKSDYPKSTKIEDLVEIQSMESGDYFLTYSKEGKASLLNFKNLIIGLANVSFATTFNDLIARVSALETGLTALTDSVALMNTTLSGLIASNTSRIAALESTVAANFTSLSSQINAINATLTNHTTRIVGLEQTVLKLSTLDVTGMVIALAGNAVPADWVICDGRELSRSTYARLFAVIGILYGGGNGTSTFNVPNMNGRVIVQKDNGSTVAPAASGLGAAGGDDTVSLSGDQNGIHTHDLHWKPSGPESRYFSAEAGNDWIGVDPRSMPSGAVGIGESVANWNIYAKNSGLGTPHNNMQPFMTMQFIIRT